MALRADRLLLAELRRAGNRAGQLPKLRPVPPILSEKPTSMPRTPRAFTHYWTNDTWKDQVAGLRLTHVAGSSFRQRGVEVGDFIYVVTIKKGDLFLAGRMQVSQMVGQDEAERLLDSKLYGANEHVIGRNGTVTRFDAVVPDRIVQQLRFEPGGRGLVRNAKGKLDQQTLRSLRELTPASAALLDSILATDSASAANPGSGVFRLGQQYTRADVYRLLGVPKERQGGDWDTGSHQHEGEWYIFASVGVPGRTGHDYENGWVNGRFRWEGRTGSRQHHAKTRAMTSPHAVVHLFTRSTQRSPFTYEGLVRSASVEDTVPVTVAWERVPPHASDPGTLRRDARVATIDDAPNIGSEPERRRSVRGQGYEADPAVRRAIEDLAMNKARAWYGRLGFDVDVTADRHPYDLRCTKKGLEVRVEVKGTRLDGSTVEVTLGEVENARGSGWRTDLFIVSGIEVDAGPPPKARGGSHRVVEGWRPQDADLKPTRFRCTVPP